MLGCKIADTGIIFPESIYNCVNHGKEMATPIAYSTNVEFSNEQRRLVLAAKSTPRNANRVVESGLPARANTAPIKCTLGLGQCQNNIQWRPNK
jgi:hypothetical protein